MTNMSMDELRAERKRLEARLEHKLEERKWKAAAMIEEALAEIEATLENVGTKEDM